MSRVYLSYRVVFHATRYLEQSAVLASCCSSAPFRWPDPMPLRRVFLPVSPMVRVLNLSHSTHGTLWKLSREAKNKKSIQLATFLRLGIVACLPNRRLKRKNADNLLFGSPIPLCGDRRESLIEKKVAEKSVFLFLQQADLPQWAALSQRVDLRNGQTRKNARLSNDVVQILQSEGVCSLLLSPWFRLLLLTV